MTYCLSLLCHEGIVFISDSRTSVGVESPFLQIGEYKFSKPILDRGSTSGMKLGDAVKFALLSMEVTVKSNVFFGGLFDVFVCERDSLRVRLRRWLEGSAPYFRQIQETWGYSGVNLVAQIPELDFQPLPE